MNEGVAHDQGELSSIKSPLSLSGSELLLESRKAHTHTSSTHGQLLMHSYMGCTKRFVKSFLKEELGKVVRWIFLPAKTMYLHTH